VHIEVLYILYKKKLHKGTVSLVFGRLKVIRRNTIDPFRSQCLMNRLDFCLVLMQLKCISVALKKATGEVTHITLVETAGKFFYGWCMGIVDYFYSLKKDYCCLSSISLINLLIVIVLFVLFVVIDC
jgi:hypothetical protein